MIKKFIDLQGNRFLLGQPISISREIILQPEVKIPDAFYLPEFKTTVFRHEDKFIGDIDQGGSCNVDILHFCPHNLTHIETSNHIVENGNTINSLPLNIFEGILYLIDISKIKLTSGLIEWHHVSQLNSFSVPFDMIGIKSKYSLISPNTSFSGKQPIALHPDLAKKINEMRPLIKMLILDTPSADIEDDGGKLLAHRNYFGLPEIGITTENIESRAIIELAYFGNLDEGLYYCISTPARIQTNAMITDVWLYPLSKEGDANE